MIRLVIILCAIAGAWRLYQLSTPEFWIEIGKLFLGVMLAGLIIGSWLCGVALWFRWRDYRREKQLYKHP